jgi:hypothetical protein
MSKRATKKAASKKAAPKKPLPKKKPAKTMAKTAAKKTPKKAAKNSPQPAKRGHGGLRLLDAGVDYPQPGAQDFGAGPNLTASGTAPNNTVSATVTLIGPNGVIGQVDVTPDGNNNWTATFNNVLPFQPGVAMQLIFEATDNTGQTVTVAVEFSQTVPPAPALAMSAAPAGNFNFTVNVETSNIDTLTASVDGGAAFAVTSGTPFTTTPADGDTQDITFEASNNSGGSAEFDFELDVDTTDPTFSSFADNSTTTAIIYSGQANADSESAFPADGGIAVGVVGHNTGTVPKFLIAISQSAPDPQTVDFTITIQKSSLRSDSYITTVTATDVFGNVTDPAETANFSI